MTDAFDAIIAEVKASEAAQPQPEVKDAATEAPTEVVTEPIEPAKAEGDGTKPEEQFSKKAVNALSRRDKKIGKLTAEKQRLFEENETLKKGQTPKETPTETKKPNPDDFNTWGEYLDARDEYNIKLAEQIADRKLNESRTKDTEQKTKNLDTEIESERAERRVEIADETRKLVSDFDKVLDAAFKGIQLKPHVIEALDEADNGALALYAFAKEGIPLTDLNDLPLAKAAMLIARYEDKGFELTKKKQVTNAPAPISPNKGNGSSGSSLANKSVEELLKWKAS